MTGAGHRLVASWGPRRWRTGQSVRGPTHCAAAYAPDGETIVFAGTRTLVTLDRQGHPVREPHVVSGTDVAIAVAVGGSRAIVVSDRSTLTVLELPSMRELFRGEAKGAYHAALSGDGEVFACGPFVHRVRDGALLDEVPDRELLTLSHDGSHALYAVREERGARVVLRAVGGNDVRGTRSGEGLSWYAAFRTDGAYVAWGRRDDLVIWETRHGGSFHIAGHGALGPFSFVGEELLVRTERALHFLAPNGAKKKSLEKTTGWLIATCEQGRRALFRGEDGPMELDLATGERLDPAPVPCAEVTRVSWDRRSHRAVVLRADGDLRMWNVRDWCSEHEIDLERAVVARTPTIGGVSPWTYGIERVSMSFTRDDAHLIASDPSATVSLLTHTGEPVWRRTFSPDPAWPIGWKWANAATEDTEHGIVVRVAWTWHRGHDPDGTPRIEDRRTVTTLDARDGSVLAHHDETEPAWSPMASPTVLPRIHLRLRGATGQVRIGETALPVPEPFGTVTGVFPSPDERTLLVATSARLLLRFDRIDEESAGDDNGPTDP